MLDESGSFSFADEVLDLVERLYCAYEEKTGRPASDRERLIGLAYVVAALRQDVTDIWAQICSSPELRGVDLGRLLAEELASADSEKQALLRAEMQRRGWLPESR